MTTRRGFLGTLVAAVAAAKLAPVRPPPLTMDEAARLFLRPAMLKIAQQIEFDLLTLYPRCGHLRSSTSE